MTWQTAASSAWTAGTRYRSRSVLVSPPAPLWRRVLKVVGRPRQMSTQRSNVWCQTECSPLKWEIIVTSSSPSSCHSAVRVVCPTRPVSKHLEVASPSTGSTTVYTKRQKNEGRGKNLVFCLEPPCCCYIHTLWFCSTTTLPPDLDALCCVVFEEAAAFAN